MCPYVPKILLCISDIPHNVLKSWHCHCISYLLPYIKPPQNSGLNYSSPKIHLLILEREGEKEKETLMGERNIDVREKHQSVAFVHVLNGNQTHNLGMCPDWESNPWPLETQDNTPINWTTWARVWFIILLSSSCVGSYSLCWAPSCLCSLGKLAGGWLVPIASLTWLVVGWMLTRTMGVTGSRASHNSSG